MDVLICGICHGEFNDIIQFMDHKKSSGAYNCSQCGALYHTEEEVQQHAAKEHIINIDQAPQTQVILETTDSILIPQETAAGEFISADSTSQVGSMALDELGNVTFVPDGDGNIRLMDNVQIVQSNRIAPTVVTLTPAHSENKELDGAEQTVLTFQPGALTTSVSETQTVFDELATTNKNYTLTVPTEDGASESFIISSETQFSEELTRTLLQSDLSKASEQLGGIFACSLCHCFALTQDDIIKHLQTVHKMPETTDRKEAMNLYTRLEPLEGSPLMVSKTVEQPDQGLKRGFKDSLRILPIKSKDVPKTSAIHLIVEATEQNISSAPVESSAPKRKRGRPRKAEQKNAAKEPPTVTQEEEMPTADPPSPPQRGPDGFYHCNQCKRSFKKDRHLLRHKCLGKGDYVDLTQKEDIPLTEAERPVQMKENDEETEVDTDITEDFKMYMPVDLPPWSRGGRGGRGRSRGRSRGRGRGAKRICIRDVEETSNDKDEASNEGNEENQGPITIFIEGSGKIENEEDSEDVQNASEDGKPKLNWRDDPHHVPVFNSEKERVAFDEHLNSVDLSCVDHLYTRHEVAQDINTEQLGKMTGRESSELLVFSCNVCKKVFKSLSHMRLHCLIHTNLKPFQCPRCSYRSNAKGNLYTHMRKHTGNYFKCSHCSFQSCNRSHLAEHEATHTSVRHQCKLCNNDYNTVKSLMNHVRKYHTGPLGRRYLSSFLAKSQMHMAVLHICHVCNRKFKKKIDRDRHLFVHNIRDSPNILHCQLCEYTAARRSYLDNHHRKHRIIYVCCICSEHFLSSVKLRCHLHNHLNLPPEKQNDHNTNNNENEDLQMAESPKNMDSNERSLNSENTQLPANDESGGHATEVNEEADIEKSSENSGCTNVICNEDVTNCFVIREKDCLDDNNFENEQVITSTDNTDLQHIRSDITQQDKNKSVELSSITVLETACNESEKESENISSSVHKEQNYLTKDANEYQTIENIDLPSLTGVPTITSLTQTLCHQTEIQNTIAATSEESGIHENLSLFGIVNSDGIEHCETTASELDTAKNQLYGQQQQGNITLHPTEQNTSKADDILSVLSTEISSETTLTGSSEPPPDQVQCVQENISLLAVLNSNEQCATVSTEATTNGNHLYSQQQLSASDDVTILSQQSNSHKSDLLTVVHSGDSSENILTISSDAVSDKVPNLQEGISLLTVLNPNEKQDTAATEIEGSGRNPLHIISHQQTEIKDTCKNHLYSQQQINASEDTSLHSQQSNNDIPNVVHTDGTIVNEVQSQENVPLLTDLNSDGNYDNTAVEMDDGKNNLEQPDISENLTIHSEQSENQNNYLNVVDNSEKLTNILSISNEAVSDEATKNSNVPSGSTVDSLFDTSLSASWYLPEPDGSLALNQYVNIPEELTEGQGDQSKETTPEEEEGTESRVEQSEEDWDQKTNCNLKYISSLNYKPLSLELYNKIRETFGQTECEVCGRLFHSRLDLEPHLLTHAENKPFKCEKCPYSAATKDNLKRHQETVHERRTFPCEQCDYTASSRTSLWHHRQKHLVTASLCQICDQSFPTPRSLRDHVLSKHPQVDKAELQKMLGANHRVIGRLGRRSYKCPYCDRVFHRSSTDLQKHMWIHEGVKPYQCSLCSHTCRSRNNLNVHMLTHTADKPFLCTECRKAYKSKTALRSHIRTHTEGSTFNCDQCDYSATQKCQLKKHAETHETPYRYICEHCDYSSSILGYMKVHYARRHKGEIFNENSIASEPLNTETSNVYKCLSCSRVLGNMSEMKNHLKEQHDVCVDDVDFTTEETISTQSVEPEIITSNEEALAEGAANNSLPEGVQMVQLQEVNTVSSILPTAFQELHVGLRDGEVDEKTASTVNVIQQLIDQGALDSQAILQLLDGQCLVAMKPETIILQEDEVLLNSSSPEGQYVIQYVTHMPDTAVEGEMTVQTTDIADEGDGCKDTLEGFQVHYDTAVQVKLEGDKSGLNHESGEMII